MSYFLQILWHGFRILTFRHRGAGLDVSKSCLVVLWMLFSASDFIKLVMVETEQLGWPGLFVTNAVLMTLMAWFSGRGLAAGLSCMTIVINLLEIALFSTMGLKVSGLSVLGLVAFVVFIIRRSADQARAKP